MSHLGKKPVNYTGKEIKFRFEKNKIFVGGKKGIIPIQAKGKISLKFCPETSQIWLNNKENVLWGIGKTILQNSIFGVTRGFSKRLILLGLGYKSNMKKGEEKLILKLGHTNPVEYAIPEDISIKCLKPTVISISGTKLEDVHRIASILRSLRKPDVYKGKGIRYENEALVLKEKKSK